MEGLTDLGKELGISDSIRENMTAMTVRGAYQTDLTTPTASSE